MRYQAKKKGAKGIELLNEALATRESATAEMDVWFENNPKGCGRKQLVDFSRWEKKYGIRAATGKRWWMPR